MEFIKELLDEIKDVYTVYKASGPNTAQAYYGYVKGSGDEAIRSEFFAQASRAGQEDEKRGVQQLIKDNGGGDDIEFEELEKVDTEEHAFMLRNEERQADPSSVTGPSVFPPYMHRSAVTKHPEIHQRMVKRQKEMKYEKLLPKILKNLYGSQSGQNIRAMNAYSRDFYDKEQIKQLFTGPQGAEAKADLKALSPEDYSRKYGVKFVDSKK